MTEPGFMLTFAPDLRPFEIDEAAMYRFTYAADRPEVPHVTDNYPGLNLQRFVEAGIKAGVIIGDPRLEICMYSDDGDRAGEWSLAVGNVALAGSSRDLDGDRHNVDEFWEHDPEDDVEEYVRAIFERVVEDANDLIVIGGGR